MGLAASTRCMHGSALCWGSTGQEGKGWEARWFLGLTTSYNIHFEENQSGLPIGRTWYDVLAYRSCQLALEAQ